MHWKRLLPIVSLAVTLPVARAAAQDTIKPMPPPTAEQQNQNPQYQEAPKDTTQTWYQQRSSVLLKGITLTPQQSATLDAINLKYKDQLPPMPHQTQRANDPSNPQAATQQQPDSAQQAMLIIILDRQDSEVRAALRPDQQKVWDKNKNEWKLKRTPVG